MQVYLKIRTEGMQDDVSSCTRGVSETCQNRGPILISTAFGPVLPSWTPCWVKRRRGVSFLNLVSRSFDHATHLTSFLFDQESRGTKLWIFARGVHFHEIRFDEFFNLLINSLDVSFRHGQAFSSQWYIFPFVHQLDVHCYQFDSFPWWGKGTKNLLEVSEKLFQLGISGKLL